MRSRWIAALGFTLLAVAPLRAQEGLEQALQLRRSGQAEASLALVEARLAAAPFDQRLQGLRGLLLLDLGRDREAAELAASLSGYAGDEFRVHCFLGRAALAQGESEAAIAHLKRALECNPKAIEPATILVQAQIAAGKLRAAIAGAEALEAVAPELGRKLGAQALVAQARRHRERGEEVTPLAVDDFKRALEKQPGDLSIVRLLVDTLIDLSFTDEARTLVEQHFGQQRDGVDWHYYMGRCHAARLELAAAEADLRAVIALQPHHVAALLELSKLALDDGRPEQARGWLEVSVEVEPGSSRAWMMLGQAHEELRDDRAAETAYRQACQLSDDNIKARYMLGRLLVRTGRDAEGQTLLLRVVADGR